MTEKKNQSRVCRYDNLKFLLMVCVVIGHCLQPYTEQARSFQSLFAFIYIFHMPAFFLLMGLYAKNTVKDWEKTKKKIIYFVILFYALKIFISVLNGALFENFFFQFLSEHGVPWFLFVSALYYGITYFLKDVNAKTLFTIAVLVGCFVGYDTSLGDFLCLSRAAVYYPFFLIGYWLDPQKLLEATDKIERKIAGAFMILLLLFLTYWKTEMIYPFRPLLTGRSTFDKIPMSKYGCIIRLAYYIIVLFVIICLIAATPSAKLPITAMGGRTLQVFFLHFALIYPLRKCGLFPWLVENTQGMVRLGGMILIGLLITLVLSTRIVEKIFNRIIKIN